MTPEFGKFFNVFGQRSTYPGSASLGSLWIDAEIVLDKFPDRYVWPFEPSDLRPSWVTDVASLNAWYWSDIVKRANAVLFLHSVKFRALLKSTEASILEANLLVLALLLRSLVEHAASLYFLARLVDRLRQLDVASLSKVQVIDKELEDDLILLSHGSRFNWKALLTGDADAWASAPEDVRPEHRQKNILTLVDKVAQDSRYGAFRAVYALLCDRVHPNFGSNLIYLKNEAVVDGIYRSEFARAATLDEVIEFIEPITGGVLSCLEIVSQKLPAIVLAIEPLGQWCQRTYIAYVKARRAKT